MTIERSPHLVQLMCFRGAERGFFYYDITVFECVRAHLLVCRRNTFSSARLKFARSLESKDSFWQGGCAPYCVLVPQSSHSSCRQASIKPQPRALAMRERLEEKARGRMRDVGESIEQR